MRHIIQLTALAGLALGLAAPAQAYSVAHHAHLQQSRINQGVATGRLTPHENNNLQDRENTITKTGMSEKSANGGTLTRGDKVGLATRQAGLSARIAVDKHNGRNAAPGGAPDAAAAGAEGSPK